MPKLAKKIRVTARELINVGFADALKTAFEEKFSRELDTGYNIFAMALVSAPADGKPFTREQKAFCATFEAGYTAAMERLS